MILTSFAQWAKREAAGLGRLQVARITARDHVSSTRTARSALLAVGPPGILPSCDGGKPVHFGGKDEPLGAASRGALRERDDGATPFRPSRRPCSAGEWPWGRESHGSEQPPLAIGICSGGSTSRAAIFSEMSESRFVNLLGDVGIRLTGSHDAIIGTQDMFRKWPCDCLADCGDASYHLDGVAHPGLTGQVW